MFNLFKVLVVNAQSQATQTTQPVIKPIKLIDPLGGKGPQSLPALIEQLANWLLIISFALAPLFYVYAAYLIMFSLGDDRKVQQGWDTVKWTSAGIVIMLCAKSIVSLINNFLGITQ